MAYTTINKPSEHFNTKLFTGTGAENAQTGVGFQPDMTWLKRRDATGSHRIYDAVRGVTKEIYPDATNVEYAEAQSLKSFDSDGFTMGTDAATNGSSRTFVTWNWKGSNATAVSNTDGSITSSVSVNTTAGFSIVSYTGTGSTTTVGHGLGAKPNIVIYKERNTTNNWRVMHDIGGTLKRLYLNATDTETSITDGSTAPTSTVLNIGTGSEVNRDSSATYIAYCFAEKKGYSKFGSYTGNGNADGAFIYTGFKPAWVVVKSTSAGNANNWMMHDNKRITYNPNNSHIYADLSNAEVTGSSFPIDLLSNGFKLRNTNGGWNLNANNYIYMAFAEAPIVGTNNVPATAR
jgi:hypothetical protein